MSLSIKEIKRVVGVIGDVADRCNVSYAVIGGAAFCLHKVKGYKTPDIDFAANYELDDVLVRTSGIERWADSSIFSWNENGHYCVNVDADNGSKLACRVDWIHKLEDGTKRLFEIAVAHRILINGVWTAQLVHAVAIRAAAGRDKDKKLVKRFFKRGIVNPRKVLSAVRKYAPTSKGYTWLKELVHKPY